jgi:hypothetical protein
MAKDTLLDELNISLLGDPILLSKSLKQQFDEVANKRLAAEKEESDYNVEQSLEIFNEQIPQTPAAHAEQSQGAAILWPSLQEAEQAS